MLDVSTLTAEWIVTLAFMAGGGWWMLKNLSSKIDDQTQSMNDRFDGLQKKDDDHDLRLNEHDNRLIRVETQVEHQRGWLKEMRDQMHAIYQKVVRSE